MRQINKTGGRWRPSLSSNETSAPMWYKNSPSLRTGNAKPWLKSRSKKMHFSQFKGRKNPLFQTSTSNPSLRNVKIMTKSLSQIRDIKSIGVQNINSYLSESWFDIVYLNNSSFVKHMSDEFYFLFYSCIINKKI